MIKKSLLIFLALFFTYMLFIITFKLLYSSQHQWQDNVIKAQNYFYNDTLTVKNVIIGSSLSCHFIMDSLPGFINLSFDGLSIFDGYNVLKQRKTLPENVYIETNVILREENEEFNDALFSPILLNLKKNIVSLRDDKQPIPLLAKYIIRLFHNCFNLPKREPVIATKSDVFAKLLNLQIEHYNVIPDSILLKKQLSLLSIYIDYLKREDVNVVFFELPTDSNLIELPLAIGIRNEFHKKFPRDSFNYIELPEYRDIETNDGVHLTIDEAARYMTYFKKQIKLLKVKRFQKL